MVTFSTCADFVGSIAGARSEFQTVAAPDGNGVCAYPKVEVKTKRSAANKPLLGMDGDLHRSDRKISRRSVGGK
jgi:hypothetical protein